MKDIGGEGHTKLNNKNVLQACPLTSRCRKRMAWSSPVQPNTVKSSDGWISWRKIPNTKKKRYRGKPPRRFDCKCLASLLLYSSRKRAYSRAHGSGKAAPATPTSEGGCWREERWGGRGGATGASNGASGRRT